MLTAFYDLRHSPPTYDFVSFLLYAEMMRQRMEASALAIRFVAGPVGGFRRDTLWPRDVETRQMMFDNVVRPMASMLPVLADRPVYARERVEGESLGFDAACYGLTKFVAAMRETGPTLRPPAAERFSNLLTITLRESPHWPERNSNLNEWLGAADALKAGGYRVVFVRDVLAREASAFDRFETDHRAASDLVVRARLYASAFCNLFVSNGPAWFAMALGVPALIFRPANDLSPNRAAHVSHLTQSGIRPGGQVPGSLPTQRLVWAHDTRDQIVRAVAEFSRSRQRVGA